MGNTINTDNNLNIITYNTKLDFYSKYKCNKLINYISNFKNKKTIICLQGLKNLDSKKYVIENIKKYYNTIIPNILDNSCNLLFISNYETYNSFYKPYSDKNNLIDVKKGVLVTNLKINSKISSFYNTELQDNVLNAIDFENIRKKQIIELLNIVKKNITFFKKKDHSGLHIILGSLYTDEIDNKNFVDIFNFYNKTIKKENHDYILFFIKKINITNLNEFIQKNLNIEIIDCSIRKELNYSSNLPLELILKI